MIASLRGVVVSKGGGALVLECAGVGREINVTAATAARLPAPGAEAFLLIVPSYAMYGGGETLYGFMTPAEKTLFCALRDEVPGTGAKKALEYLDKASKSLPDFRRALVDRDEKLLCAVFGFTNKTAAKLIAALKDKIEEFRVDGSPRVSKAVSAASGTWGQALAALEALGYKPSEARSALQTLTEDAAAQSLPAEQLVRQALKRL